MDIGQILGRGISFPPRVGADGRLGWSEGEQNIREAIQVILSTEPGERLRRSDFGGGLGRFLFEPNTVTTRHRLEQQILESVAAWEPRVSVDLVDVQPDPDDPQGAIASITYKLVATQATQQLTMAVTLAP